MRKLQITLIALFLAVAIAFCAVFLHDRLTAYRAPHRLGRRSVGGQRQCYGR